MGLNDDIRWVLGDFPFFVCELKIIFDYAVTSNVMNYLKKKGITIQDTKYDTKTELHVAIRQNDVKEFIEAIEDIISVKIVKP